MVHTRRDLAASAASVLCALAAIAGAPAGAAALEGTSSGTGSLWRGSLVIAGSPNEAEQLRAEEEARIASPEASLARVQSETAYEGFDRAESEALVGRIFPALVREQDGGLPQMAGGVHVTKYLGAHAARVSLSAPGTNGGPLHGVIETLGAVAVKTATNCWEAVDLGLEEKGAAYIPKLSDLTVRIPQNLSEGVSLPETGVSLTPLNESGSAAASASPGTVDGDAVFWAGVSMGRNIDVLAKPSTSGFDLLASLRGQSSPEVLRFRVAVPHGASLIQSRPGGVVRVRDVGQTIASILPPGAQDAQGTPVPVSMSVAGDVLTLNVPHPAGRWNYPIKIDPVVEDSTLGANPYSTNWRYVKDPEEFGSHFWAFDEGSRGWQMYNDGTKSEKDWGALIYPTQGQSEIYAFTSTTLAADSGSGVTNYLDIADSSGWQASLGLPQSYSSAAEAVCLPGCGPESAPKWGNEAQYLQYAASAGNGGENTATAATVYIYQAAGPSIAFDTSEPTVKWGEQNVLYGSGGWLGPHHGAFEVKASDPGLGLTEVRYSSPSDPEWKGTTKAWECVGVQCEENMTPELGYKYEGHSLPDGNDTVEVAAYDSVGLSQTATAKVKVDGTPPHSVTLAGLPSDGQLGDHEYQLQASATDGSGSTPSSGIASLALTVDGRQIGQTSGSCSPGPCEQSAKWTLNGIELAAGKQTLAVIATDNAGNVAKEEVTITVHHASLVPVGPGSVNPTSGEFSLSATDVSQVGGMGRMLTVGRSYRSEHLSAGAGGPLGAPWSISIGGQQSINVLPGGQMALSAVDGTETVFTNEGGGAFKAPEGDAGLTLAEKSVNGEGELLLSRDGATTTFRHPAGGPSSLFVPSISEGPGGTDVTTFAYQTVQVEGQKMTEPVEALAPVPNGVSCSPQLKRGCRALTFNYATETTAKGGTPEEWGDCIGHLTRVYFTAWSSASDAMKTVEVAHYLYDSQGRLRTVWDPQVSPALKTTYGYDAEGRVTAISPPGLQPWLMTYGTAVGGPSLGHLLSVSRPRASTALGSGLAPASTAVPALSSSEPAIGTALSVAKGSWSDAPIAYGYQWDDCNASGGECKAIPGATNESYTPVESDREHALVAEVVATNAGGSTTVSSAASAAIVGPYTYARQFGSEGAGDGQFKHPVGVAFEPVNEDVLVADTGNDRMQRFSATGGYVEQFGEAGSGDGQLESPEGVADGPEGLLYVADTGNARVQWFWGSGWLMQFGQSGSGSGELQAPAGVATTASSSDVYVADAGEDRVQVFSLGGGYEWAFGSEGFGAGQLSGPHGIAVAPNGDVYVADSGNNRIEEFSSYGEYGRQFGSLGSGDGQLSDPQAVAIDEKGHVWVADTGNDRVEEFSATGAYMLQYGSAGSGDGQFDEPRGIAVDSTGDVYVADTGNNRVQELVPGGGLSEEPAPNPPGAPSNAVTTIEYKVPLSGAGSPYQLGAKETETWAQQDDPVEGTAIFPPDEPMGWPATGYRKATVYYLDAEERAVNVASPSQGNSPTEEDIATSEYNETNDVVRSLSAEDRAVALKEGAKSVEVAQRLSTRSEYSEDGTDLLSTLGPEHTVKLDSGREAQARSHTVYSYDEGAPKTGGPYRLVTKTTQGVEVEGEAEQDVRTTVTSYAGQNDLGWALRRPTSTTVDPGGLDVVHTTVYDPGTGNVVETRSPAAGAEGETHPSGFMSQWGSEGSGNGQFSKPDAVAVDAEGNTWVADTQNNRIEEFSAAGTFIRQTSGPERLYEPQGIAIDGKGNVWVADTGDGVVREFSSIGEYVATYGDSGIMAGMFSEPTGIAVVSVEGSEEVYVADRAADAVVRFLPEGEGVFAGWLGEAGSGNGQLSSPHGLAVDANGNIWVADTGNNRVEEFNAEWRYQQQFVVSQPSGVALDSEGDLWVGESGSGEVQEFSPTGEPMQHVGAAGGGEGQLREPGGLAVDGSGHVYVADTGNDRVEKWIFPSLLHESSGTGGMHGTQTFYYSAAASGSYPECGERPEWANLPCRTQPAAQPETEGVPNLPVMIVTYNIWDEPVRSTSTVGTSTRTTTASYDEAGRLIGSDTTSSSGTALPAVSDRYSESTGVLLEESSVVEGETQSLKSTFNGLGQLTSYADASGATTSYEYEEEGEMRLRKVIEPKGSQTYGYDATTGALTRLEDSAAGAFTAAYDVEGNMVSESYPDGLVACFGYSRVGEETSLSYYKGSGCGEGRVWFSDGVVPSAHGQWASQQSSLSLVGYGYDALGRLVEVREVPVGEGCTTRLYGYDVETNRLSLTTRPAGAEGACAGEGGSVEDHSYDPANRLVDAGTAYDPFGEVARLPAIDAGGSVLESRFFVDGQLAEQSQAGETIGYRLDPQGRVLQRVDSGSTSASTIDHYAAPGGGLSWSEEPTTGRWSRYVDGIGGLAAIQEDGAAPVLQLEDLQGNIVATASLGKEAAGLLSVESSSEYGVPSSGNPKRYGWLGGDLLPRELPSGVVLMGVRSYVPQIGRFLQPDPVPGGSANEYAYTYGSPVNESDPSGASVATPDWTYAVTASEAQASVEAARQAAARAEAERKAAEAAAAAAAQESQAPTEGGAAEWGEAAPEVIGSWAQSSSGPGGRRDPVAHAAAGGCPSTHDPCYPKHGKGGKRNEGGTGSCRSGGKRNKKGQCEKGKPKNEGSRIFTEIVCYPAKYFAGVCQEWIEPDEAR